MNDERLRAKKTTFYFLEGEKKLAGSCLLLLLLFSAPLFRACLFPPKIGLSTFSDNKVMINLTNMQTIDF